MKSIYFGLSLCYLNSNNKNSKRFSTLTYGCSIQWIDIMNARSMLKHIEARSIKMSIWIWAVSFPFIRRIVVFKHIRWMVYDMYAIFYCCRLIRQTLRNSMYQWIIPKSKHFNSHHFLIYYNYSKSKQNNCQHNWIVLL